MPGRKSRNKGASAEREVVNIFKTNGFHAFRTAPMQAGSAAEFPDVIVQHNGKTILRVEVKRRARIPDYISRYPNASNSTIVAVREDRGNWLAVVDLQWLVDLLLEIYG